MSLSIDSSKSYQVSTGVAEQSLPASGGLATSLLPPPSGDPQTDAMSWLYVFISKQQSLDVNNGKHDIDSVQRTRNDAYKQEMDAIRAAVEAAKHHSFWDSVASVALTIGKVAAVVGSIALAVGTGGAGVVAVLAVAGAVLSTAGFVQSETHVLQKMGVDDGTATWVGIGLSVGGAACSGGAGLLSSAGETAATASTAVKVTAAASGVALGAGGVATIESGNYAADQADDLADSASAQMDQARLQWLLFAMLDDLKASQESDNNALGSLRGALNTKGDTLVLTSTMRA